MKFFVEKILISWILPVFIAFLAASIIHQFLIESFINRSNKTCSLLLDGDYVAVYKSKKINRNQLIAIKIPSLNKKHERVCFRKCIAKPGDTFLIYNKEVFVNKKLIINNFYRNYKFLSFNKTISDSIIRKYAQEKEIRKSTSPIYEISLRKKDYHDITKINAEIKIVSNIESYENRTLNVYPFSDKHRWTKDNFGPVIVPKKNMTLKLNSENIELYFPTIKYSENKNISLKNNEIFIDNTKITEYTFSRNYYFVMNLLWDDCDDSRQWGFITEDQILGKAWFTWWSVKNGHLKFDRIFHKIQNL